MGTVTVRVVPRAGRTAVEAGPQGITVRVREVRERGRATEAARRALARALGVPPSRVSLHHGIRARVKTFSVVGLSGEELQVRLGAR
ncbi:MAG TPA: DUF167 family protein [Actinomycetota bacterium]|nr:DUF167 family protein [Actinomycetota bacterium]